MKRKSLLGRRLLAAAVSLTMLGSLVQGFSLPVKAAGTEQNYVSLPITIRDYAADGMLFEFNDMGDTGDYHKTDSSGVSTTKKSYGYYMVNPSTWAANSYCGIRICTYGNNSWTSASLTWHCIICKNDGTVVKVIPAGTAKGSAASGAYYSAMKSGYYAVWVWKDDTANYNAMKVVTDANKAQYKVTYNTSTKQVTLAHTTGSAVTETYHYGNTKGYGLLETTAASHFNDLTNSTSIPGTVLTQNGAWDAKPEAIVPKKETLNSGAPQQLFGAYIRTNLVEPNLADGKIVYTEATVTYLAKHMQKTLPVAWKNSDGTYNMWHVMGTKLYDNNNQYVGPNAGATKDLASVLRSTITGGLGSYTDTKTKTLNEATDCKTYFDAAYFLLHNTFTDNAGYGMTVSEYSKLNMVAKTDSSGNTYYVFNSAYDNAKYDTVNGEIYNTQTDTITTREGTTYVRGNLQPEARFDPIGAIGNGNAYYGKNGSRYLEVVDKENELSEYYNKTNYNLSLEGHAKFIYYQDSDLYFTFTGDDDVYLYINGIRVLDLGGAHAISKAKININDVARMCGLEDGKPYDFDFFYMERHGTAANFGIETNIKIVDPHMLTTKTGFQNGGAVGYNGFVNPEKPVTYQFTLQNNGDADIQELTFKDDDIGAELTKDKITLNSETNISDLRVTLSDAQGATVKTLENMSDDAELKQVLADGLKVGYKLTIYGFNYTIPDGKWQDNAFVNYVYTTAVSHGENTSTQTLNGMADYKVQKQEFVFENLHYYEWKGHGVTGTKDELLAPVAKVVKNLDTDNAVIELCTPSGNPDGILNPRAVLEDNNVTYTGDKTGADQYYYNVKVGNENYGPVRVDVYSYDVADNAYVLDYGLPVELNEGEAALTSNDVLSLAGTNPYATTYAVTGISENTSAYGDFKFDKNTNTNTASLVYTLDKFMSGTDQVKVTIEVKEEGAASVTKTTGVTMTQWVTTVPANVMYYEDTFTDITYIGEDGNEWLLYETVGADGNKQSADQDSNYGSDPNYDKDQQKDLILDKGNLTEEELKEAQDNLGSSLEGDASDGSIHAMKIDKTDYILRFNFTGTGFEIVSRTTAGDYAVLMVEVYTTSEADTEGARPVKAFPVITESKGGDLYQVPIISVMDLAHGSYTVKLKGAKSTETATRLVYIDGIRIYGPLADEDEALEYYNPEEKQAEFKKVKGEIADSSIVYTAVNSEVAFATGATMIENTDPDEKFVLREAESVEEYLKLGPNNELYLDGGNGAVMIAFYVRPDENVAADARTIQIGAHRKADSLTNENQSVTMVYGSTAEEISAGNNKYEIKSGTEQYYTIDISKLTPDESGRYLVMIGTNGGNNSIQNTLVLTNLKISGYTLRSPRDEIQQVVETNDEGQSLMVQQIMQFRRLNQPAPEIPVNENLSILSAQMKSAEVKAGKKADLSVITTLEGSTIQLLDAEGSEVELSKVKRKEKNGEAVFDLSWNVSGNPGDILTFTVRVLDAEGAYAVNEETVTLEIR